jgi:nitrate/TMAO reductase-like tetraheme cytochrome c subunit
MKSKIVRTFAFVIAVGSTCVALAESYDHDEEEENSTRVEESSKSGTRSIAASSNPTYKQECASCHMLYPAGLLPSRSWKSIMTNLKTHFGENASIDPQTAKVISEYLDKNSADKSTQRRSLKIAASIGKDEVPIRISETLYFKRKHHEISPMVWERKSIGSRANCVACHGKAESGVFSEDQVRIPR